MVESTWIKEGKWNGLTGISIEARGFAGTLNFKHDTTKGGRSRLTFDLACGRDSKKENKFTTWLHCICYDHIARGLNDLRPGHLVRITSDFVVTEGILDDKEQLVLKDGRPVTRQSVICATAFKIASTGQKQGQLPLAVGQASR